MAQAGYDKAFATAVVSVASGLAIIIPPSISFIVYGDIMEQSVGTLFAAGIVPGIIVAGFLCLAVYVYSRRNGFRGEPRGDARTLLLALADAFWGLMTPVIILGGIYGGIFTPTEAAAVAVFYGLFVLMFFPPILTSPASAFQKPTISFIMVDFPPPDGPTKCGYLIFSNR